jgi:hypothetical protein
MEGLDFELPIELISLFFTKQKPRFMKRLFLVALAATLLSGCYTKSSTYLFSLGDGPEEIYQDSIAFTRQSRLIIFPVTIQGKTYRFLFDTGAPMVVSEELAKTLKMKRVSRKSVGDSQGKREKLNYVRMDEITVGHKSFTNLTAIVADLKRAPAINCLNIDGIVGGNLMRMAIWDIDYEKEVMYFTNDFEHFEPDTNAFVMPFETKVTGTPIVTLVVESDTLKNITFDTGSAGGLSVFKERIKSDSIKPAQLSYGYHSQGLFGSTPDTNRYAEASLVFENGRAPLPVLTMDTRWTKDILGQRFFQDYRIVLNWLEKKAYLSPVSAPEKPTYLGISAFFEEGKMYVGTIVFGSEADLHGLKPGDQIIQVNGMNLESASVEDYCKLLELWRSDNPDITVTVKDKQPLVLKEVPLFAE